MAVEKIDANVVGFFMTEQTGPKTLPDNPVWRTREPNSFDDMGGDYKMVARRPFSPSRQRKKGSTVDLDVTGGFNEDLTQNNMQWPLQGFMFADLREKSNTEDFKPAYAKTFTIVAATDIATTAAHGLTDGEGPFRASTTTTLPAGLANNVDYWVHVLSDNTYQLSTSKANALATPPVVVNATDAGTGVQTLTRAGIVDGATETFAMDDATQVYEGSLLLGTGFADNANNGLHYVDTVTGARVTVTSNLVTEAVPPSTAKLQLVGFEFPAGDVSIELRSGVAVLISAATDLTGFGLVPGEWVFLGGDAAGTRFADNEPGYARVKSVIDEEIVFDKTTWTPDDDDGATKTVRIFFGTVLKNEDDEDLIKTRYYQQERTLGRDNDGRQAQYTVGNVANELTWNSPLADKVSLDLGFMALATDKRSGLEGPKSRDVGATILKALGEDAFNTSKNVYRLRMSVVDPDTLNPLPLFARVTEWTATIANNASAAKAQGTLGGFDVTVGGFDVDMTCTAYFTTVAAIDAIENNDDVTFDAIYSRKNAAIILDLPLIALGGGKLQIEQDQAIMVPLENSAAESTFGHTMLLNWLPYVPNIGVA